MMTSNSKTKITPLYSGCAERISFAQSAAWVGSVLGPLSRSLQSCSRTDKASGRAALGFGLFYYQCRERAGIRDCLKVRFKAGIKSCSLQLGFILRVRRQSPPCVPGHTMMSASTDISFSPFSKPVAIVLIPRGGVELGQCPGNARSSSQTPSP